MRSVGGWRSLSRKHSKIRSRKKPRRSGRNTSRDMHQRTTLAYKWGAATSALVFGGAYSQSCGCLSLRSQALLWAIERKAETAAKKVLTMWAGWLKPIVFYEYLTSLIQFNWRRASFRQDHLKMKGWIGGDNQWCHWLLYQSPDEILTGYQACYTVCHSLPATFPENHQCVTSYFCLGYVFLTHILLALVFFRLLIYSCC